MANNPPSAADFLFAAQMLAADLESGIPPDLTVDEADSMKRVIKHLTGQADRRVDRQPRGFGAPSWDTMARAARTLRSSLNMARSFGGSLAEIAELEEVADMLDGRREHPLEEAVVAALIDTGLYSEVDGDGDPESVIGRHIRDLPDMVRAEYVVVDSGSDVETLYVRRTEPTG